MNNVMMIEQMEKKVNELATQVIPGDALKSFLELDLKSKLVGIGVFAQLGKDEKMVKFSLDAIKYIEDNKLR